MTPWRVGLVALIVIGLAACSAGRGDAPGTSAAGRAPAVRSGQDQGAPAETDDDQDDSAAPVAPSSGTDSSGGRSDGGPKDAGGTAEAPSSDADPGTSSHVDDPSGDVVGPTAPAYADITDASISAHRGGLQLRLSFAGELPSQLPEDETVLAGFGILDAQGEPEYAFFVEGSNDGWQAFRQADGRQSPFHGRLDVAGTTLTLSPAWRDVDGRRSFDWGVSARWFGAGAAGAIEQGSDRAPESGSRRYPE